MDKFYIIAKILLKYITHNIFYIVGKNIMIYDDLVEEFPSIKNYRNWFDFNINYTILDWEDIINNIEKLEHRNKIIDSIING